MRKSKLVGVTEATDHVDDGMFIGLGGLMLYNKPMALARAIANKGVQGLTILCAAPSTIDIDLLVGAGCASTVIFQSITVERAAPVGPRFRAAGESGTISYVDCDQGMINAGMRAARFGLPSLTTVAGLGGDYPEVEPDWVKQTEDPFTGRPLLSVRAMRPDVAVVHAAVADEYGHAQQLGTSINDELLCAAADKIVVSAEQIVTPREIQARRAETFTWAYKVAAVVEAPFGAHPAGSYGRYAWDGAGVQEYVDAAKTQEGFDAYEAKYITDIGGDHLRYLDAVGWKRLGTLRERRGSFADTDAR